MSVGSTCPPIGGLQFIKGDPISVPCPDHVTVIESWATWCPPCRDVFPHLSKLAKQYESRGLRVMGVTAEAPGPQLQAFVTGQGANMDYRVAVDAAGEVHAKLATPAGARGIPHAYLVDMHGVVRYSGHPADPSFDHKLQTVCAEWESAHSAPPLEITPEGLANVPVKQLKAELQRRSISYAGLVEKNELIEALLAAKR